MPKDHDIPAPVTEFLKEKQFTVVEGINNPRYWVLRVTTPQHPNQLMLKIEKGKPRISLQQRNHVLWARSMRNVLPKDAPFHIAPVLEDGFVNGTWHWFTMPFVDGESFAKTGADSISAINVSDPEEILPRIVLLMKYVEKATAQSVAGIDARYESISRKDKAQLLETAISWARNDTPFLAELLQLIQANYVNLSSANAHGDFTGANLIINDKREPVLIDAEIGSAYHYKYYDAAEFYNRLYTSSCEPKLAEAFLREYVRTLPRRTVQRFLNNFLCLSALRCIGNFMEISSLPEGAGKQKRLLYATRYATDIVTYKIIQIGTGSKAANEQTLQPRQQVRCRE